jgi:predicted Zn-dependent protease with MMP-like domain
MAKKPSHQGYSTPPGLDDIEAIAAAAFETIPDELRRHVAEVHFVIEDFPNAEVEREMGLSTPFDLLGLYTGVPIDRQSVTGTPNDIDRIVLYRRPILDYWCETGEDLEVIVRHVLIHEVGHHFGFSDDDMERIEEAS